MFHPKHRRTFGSYTLSVKLICACHTNRSFYINKETVEGSYEEERSAHTACLARGTGDYRDRDE
ncbi:hypothetical protein KSF_067860 [Reticulibacter mediterranei]|uniref:Uncharacterized protein n=1 Tax=Reticulibacter mediterranei TaxID=2778369 RepID=A0A8J3IMI4_9CHLR|nr:hypothetical protein KSF_067860 [Reticulibacter mediterranei]